jgi:hypothetical protein
MTWIGRKKLPSIAVFSINSGIDEMCQKRAMLYEKSPPPTGTGW